MAMSASGACRLPTCLCARPCWLRTKTSHRGHSRPLFLLMLAPRWWGSGGARLLLVLLGVRDQRVTEPAAVLVGLHAGAQALPVAGAVALQDLMELGPVDRAEVVVAALLVPAQVRVGNGEAQVLGLGDRLVHHALTQF